MARNTGYTACIALQRMVEVEMARTGQLTTRMDSDVITRLDRCSTERGEAKSRLAERLIDEGLRMIEFPGIVFVDGPTGRRATLTDGPDVWEIVADLKRAKARKGDPVAIVARGTGLRPDQIRLAAAYYGRYPAEVDVRIERNQRFHDDAEAALRRLPVA